MSLNFSVELVNENNNTKTEVAAKAPDPRKLAERMFTIFDAQTGEVSPMPIKAFNCSVQTAADQGYKGYDLANTIPVFLGYKSGVADFAGPTKNRDFVVIGKRPGRPQQGGNPGLMVDVAELDVLIEQLTALRDTLNPEAVNELRQAYGLSAKPIPQQEPEQVPPTEEA